MGKDATTRLISAGGWTILSRGTAQVAQLAAFLVAARVLSPADFGLYAMVQAIAQLFLTVGRSGWKEYLLSRSNSLEIAGTALGVAALSGLILFAAGLATLGSAAALNAPSVVLIAGVILSVCVVISPIAMAYEAVFLCQEKVPHRALTEMVSEILSLIATVLVLLNGFGLIALAIGKVTATLTMLIGGIAFSRTLPAFGGALARVREYFEFTRHFVVTDLVAYIANNTGALLSGVILGPAAAGFFRAGERVVGAIAELALEPVRIVGWQFLGGDRADGRAKGAAGDPEATGQFIFVTALTVAPIFIGMAIVSTDLVDVLLGEAWRPAAIVVALLSLARLAALPAVTVPLILSFYDAVDRIPRIEGIVAGIGVVGFAVAAPFGLAAAAGSRLLAGLVHLILSVRIQDKIAAVSWLIAIRAPATLVLALIAMAVATIGTRTLVQEASAVVGLAVAVAAGAFAYGVVVYLGSGQELRRILEKGLQENG